MAGHAMGHQLRRVTRSQSLDRLARFGLICRGVLYMLIGLLALRVSFGTGEQEADESGAIRTLADQPFGTAILWLMLVGFLALAGWQLTELVVGTDGVAGRIEAGGRTGFYVLLVATLANLLLAGGQAESGDQHAHDLTAKALELPAGQLLVGAGGLAVLGLGAYWIYQVLSRQFLRHLHTEQLTGHTRPIVTTLGVVGYLTRGLVAGLAGVFLIRAAVTYQPDQAKGLDGTLRSFADTAAGPWLLTIIAVGLLAFAAYCFCEARWRRV